MLISEKIKNTRKLRSNFGFMFVMNSPTRNTRQRNPEPSVNIHVDKRKKQKYPQIAQQFWVLACYELPQ